MPRSFCGTGPPAPAPTILLLISVVGIFFSIRGPAPPSHSYLHPPFIPAMIHHATKRNKIFDGAALAKQRELKMKALEAIWLLGACGLKPAGQTRAKARATRSKRILAAGGTSYGPFYFSAGVHTCEPAVSSRYILVSFSVNILVCASSFPARSSDTSMPVRML